MIIWIFYSTTIACPVQTDRLSGLQYPTHFYVSFQLGKYLIFIDLDSRRIELFLLSWSGEHEAGIVFANFCSTYYVDCWTERVDRPAFWNTDFNYNLQLRYSLFQNPVISAKHSFPNQKCVSSLEIEVLFFI
jgi:hypothetical protein